MDETQNWRTLHRRLRCTSFERSKPTLPTKEVMIKGSWKKSLNEFVKKKKTHIYPFFQNKINILHCNTATQVSTSLLRQQEVNDNYWTGVPCSDTQSNLERVYIHKSMTRCLIQSVISAKILLQHHLIKRHHLKNSLCIA